jgi:hypothetical protein
VNQYCNNAILSILGEEELSDVSLSTFYVFDKESAKSRLVTRSPPSVPAPRVAAPCDIGASAMPA